jgi:hypothetical protein
VVVVAVALAFVAAVVLAAVAAVVLAVTEPAAVEALDAPLDALAAMHPVRMAAVATPASPVTRRARRAACGRRRRAVRAGVVSFVLFSMMCIAGFPLA